MSDRSALVKEAQKYLARGQVEKAIGEWEKIAKEYPDGNAYNTVGDLYLKKGDKANAVESFHKAASFFQQEGFALKALALYKKILNLAPTDAAALFALGELNEGKGLTTDAIKFYLAAADSLSKEGKKEKILEIYDRILALSPSNIPLRNKVAEIYVRDGLISEAAKQYLHVAELYIDKLDIEKAITFYRKVLELQPVSRQAIVGIADLYEKAGDLSRAVEQIREAVSLFPGDPEILFKSADMHIGAARHRDALGYLEQILEIEPSNIRARRLIGDIYTKTGDRTRAWSEYLPVLDDMILEEKYDDAIHLLEGFKDIDPLETGKRLVSLYRQIDEQDHVLAELVSLGDLFASRDLRKEALNCYREAVALAPDDLVLKSKVVEFEKESVRDTVSIAVEKSVEDAILEADIYIRYGLFDNARDLLESFKAQYPEDTNLHLKLKSLYEETGDKEMAVTECIVLSNLYRRAGEEERSEQIIRDAHNIDPEDPRLNNLPKPEPETPEASPPEGPSIEDYSEEISEAAFYEKQGLLDEAREILERLQNLFPENTEISQRLATLGQFHSSEDEMEMPEEHALDSVSLSEEALAAEEISEPALDDDVLDIFNEFKKGLEKELADEDYETHYNLGIAYKEMGLIDDAIREFQAARNDPKRFVHSSNMLGICYIEKGLNQLAIDVLKSAIEKMEDRGESYWAMNYDLAEAYEK
ncbi:MAG TPA: tetratricopeptide repeat protein, partial [Thermodesulfovibrionales bacterium]|nr:tetratricopeptide repeat protein [Thermodesulfovibrionales bacterium]